MRKNIVLIIGLIVIIISSCGNQGSDLFTNSETNAKYSEYYEDASDDYAYDEAVAAEYEYSEELDEVAGSYEEIEEDLDVATDIKNVKIPDKIIKTGTIDIEVENYDEAILKIKNDIKKWDGYISNENENAYSYMTSNVLTIRVLSENFENLVQDVCENVKKVESKSISAVDVSEEFVDLQARLKTKKEVEKRYIELLNKAYDVQDILYVEDKIRVIREEIEAKEGRLKYLSDRVAFSTITLDIKQYYENDKYEPGFGDDIGDALSTGWSGFLKVLVGLMYLWPLWLITGVGLYVLLKLLNRSKRKNKQ
jgi:hypothetical protein